MCSQESTQKRKGKEGGEEGEFKRPRPVLLTRKKQYSDKLADCVKTFCCECDQVVALSGIRKHLSGVHKMTLTEYRGLYGNPEKQIIRMVFHSCGVCKKDVVLDYLQLVKHLRKEHSIKGKAFTEYNNKFLKMIRIRNQGKRSISPRSKKAMQKVEDSVILASTTPPTSTPITKEDPSPITISSTSPRVAPVPTCSLCSKLFKSNMQLKMHTRREHVGA